MFHSCNFEFKKPVLMKKGAGIKNTYSAIASTASLDRHKEVLVPRGVMIEKFMTNPVMLNIHNHHNLPVGKVTDIKVTKEAVQFDFQFADTEEGVKLEKLYNSGFMNAFSVGFIPKNYVDLYSIATDGTSRIDSIDVELPDGTSETIDLTKYAEKPYGVISKWELLEISPVPIPANPDALMLRAADTIVRKFVDAGHSKAAASLLEKQLSDRIADIQKDFDSLLDHAKSDKVELSCAVPYSKCEVVDEAWNAEDARAALVLWSCTDKEHAGEAEFVDWGQFAKGFGWVDLEKADKFIGYKLAHHQVKDSELCVVWRGLTEAMADLLGDPSLYQDAEKVYQHLAAHYVDFGKTAPEFGKDYGVDELADVREGKDLQVTFEITHTAPCDGSGDGTEDTSQDPNAGDSSNNSLTPESVKTLVSTGFASLKDQIAELEEVVRLRMNILGRMFDELQKDLLSSKQPAKEETHVEDGEEAKLFAQELKSLSSMFEDIHSVK